MAPAAAADTADTADGTTDALQERYRNGFFLAPMVRVGTLPLRLLCLEYGADLVWTSEVVDKSITGCERVVDSATGVVSFVRDGRCAFTTHPDEKQRVIFQLGSARPEMALEAARVVEGDVSGIDLNCGCPKKFSVHGGMGAALLSDPDRLCSILDVLVKNISVPISCKIRVLEDDEKTLALVRRIAATGISALTVHCRTRSMRPREKALWDRLGCIVRELAPLPVILNGDVFEFDDVRRGRECTGATSAMAARGAAANPSIFRPEGPVPAVEAVVAYAKTAMRVGNHVQNTKYTLMQMYPDTKSAKFEALRSAKSYADICAVLELAEPPAITAAAAAAAAAGPAKRSAAASTCPGVDTPTCSSTTPDGIAHPQKRIRS